MHPFERSTPPRRHLRVEVTGKLFVDRTSARQLPYTTAFEQLQRLAGTAGIPDTATITSHSLRHTFATLCLEANVPLQDVQDALGHSDPRTTRLYDKRNLAHDRTRRTAWPLRWRSDATREWLHPSVTPAAR